MLEVACAKHLERVGWAPQDSRKRVFADLLARKIFAAPPGQAVNCATRILNSLGPASEVAREVVEMLAPLWVEPDAATSLETVARSRPQGERDVALNGRYLPDFTAQMYVHRAYPLSREPLFLSVDDSDAGDFAEHVAARLRESLRAFVADLRNKPDAFIDRWMRQFPNPVFVLLPRVPPHLSELERLRAAFEKVTFIVPTDEHLPPAGALGEEVRYLRPELDVDHEETAYFALLNARATVAAPGPP
jgi:hypothetical protein